MPELNSEEVDNIIARASGNLDENGDFDLDVDEEPEVTARPEQDETKAKSRRGRKRKNGGEEILRDIEGSSDREMTVADLGAKSLLPDDLPKPMEKVKTLGTLISKYGIGENPDFKLQVHRTYPKMFPGGHKADGFYDSWDQPLTEELIQSEYGGGNYRVVVIGPSPNSQNGTQYYDSITLSFAGEPKYNRIPKALQDPKGGLPSDPMPSPLLPMIGAPEHPKLAEQAMKMAADMAERERTERHRAETRVDERASVAHAAYQPILDAERRRADDQISAARERGDLERSHFQEQLATERAEMEGLKRKMEHIMERPVPSVADELGKLKAAGLLGNNESGNMAQVMLEKILEKHRGEVESMSRQNGTFIEQLRSSHASEIQATRAAHARELEAEREAGRSRESRVEERLNSEREERRRDSDRFREVLAERDLQWKDRLEQQRESLNNNWEARHSTVVGANETRIAFLNGELDRLKAELLEARQKTSENSDPIAQLERLGEMREHMTKALGIEKPSPSSGGGIGLGGGGGEDWKSMAVEGLVDRLPTILEKVGGMLGGGQPQIQQQQQQQQQFQLGQLVKTAQGEMIVVQTPNGMMLAPRADVERQQRAGGMGNMLPANAPQRRTSAKGRGAQKPKRRTETRRPDQKVSVTQNFAADLPKRRPPWEGGGEEDGLEEESGGGLLDETPSSVITQSEPRREPEPEPIELNAMERQGISMIAKHVHESVMQADEPAEFVEKMTSSYPANVLSRIVGGYTTDQILRAVRQVEPNGAGATPAGQQFIRAALQLLRQALSGAGE